MRCLLLPFALLLAGCGGHRALGDDAFARKDYQRAVAHYEALLDAKGLSAFQIRRATQDPKDAERYVREGRLSLAEQRDTIEATRRALRGRWAPAVDEAKALFADGFPVLALQLVGPACEPGGLHFVHGEVVPGACALVDQIVQRLEQEASGGGMPDFTRATRVRAAVARTFYLQPPPALSAPLVKTVLAAVKAATAEKQHTYAWAWLASLTRAQGQMPSGATGQFSHGETKGRDEVSRTRHAFNLAAYRMASANRDRSRAVQATQPWLAQVFAGLAQRADPRHRAYGAITGGVNLEPGAVRGACAAEVRKALAHKAAGPTVVLDLDIRGCERRAVTRTYQTQQAKVVTEGTRRTVRDPIHRYAMQEVCEDVRVCKHLRTTEKYWLAWNTCAREHVVVERRCRQVKVRVGTDWSAPQEVTGTRRRVRTVTVDKAYTVHRWTLDAQVTAHVGGQTVRYPVTVAVEGPDARTAGFRGWTQANTALATHPALVATLKGQRARDPVDDLARRLVAGETLTANAYHRLSEATDAPAWVLAEAFDAVDRSAPVAFHRMALADAPKAVDWAARWADVPPWTAMYGRHFDTLHPSVHVPPMLLHALRAVELAHLPGARWDDVLPDRLAVDRGLATRP